ncbi:cyclic nucleotide-binding domain-containing protein [Clostridium sp. CTA-19]
MSICDYFQPYLKEMETIFFKKGSYIITSDEEFEEVFYILDGVVTVECINAKGKMFLVDSLKKGDFVGKLSYIYEADFRCDIIANTNVKLLKIHKSTLSHLKKNADFVNLFFFKTSKRIYYIYKKMLIKDLFKIEEIFAYHILTHSLNNVFEFKSMYELCKELSISRKSLYNTLNNFFALGYVDKKSNSIIILNRAYLEKLSENLKEFY